MSTRKCEQCGISKDILLFHKYKPSSDPYKYRRYKCKDCESSNKKANPNTRSNYRDWMLFNKYGITSKEYDKFLSDQGGVCAICGQAETHIDPRTNRVFLMSVDHCHLTGKVRGILCNNCNRGIGFFKDNISLLNSASAYLNKHK